MAYQVRMLRGLFAPYNSVHQLKKAEQIHGIWKGALLLIFISVMTSAVGSFFGIENESLSKNIYNTSPGEFEVMKGLFALGSVLQSMVSTATVIFFPALIFWVFTDIEYKKLVVIQLFVVLIFMFEKVVAIPFQLFFGLDHDSSPFSFGVIAQYITDYEFVIHFLSNISLFGIWTMILQFYFLKITSEKGRNLLFLLIVSINLFMWLFSALFSYIRFEALF